MKKTILIGSMLFVMAVGSKAALAAEPVLADYTSAPVFTVNPVKPNILIILDNSGSMNFNAYGSWPGNGGVVADGDYAGEPYYPSVTVVTQTVQASADDAEEQEGGSTWVNSDDLDMGRVDSGLKTTIGVRFQNIAVPQGAEITKAWIEFKVDDPIAAEESVDISLRIYGEDSDAAAVYSATANNITSRDTTQKKVYWDSTSTDPQIGNWVGGDENSSELTPNIKEIVQEIVDRDGSDGGTGWVSGNAMAFMIDYHAVSATAKRDVKAYDGHVAGNRPLLHIEYSSAGGTRYYGYFNPDWFYSFSSNTFELKYKKAGYDTDVCVGEWEVEDPIGGAANFCLTYANIATGDDSTGYWDGNWMNWATSRRIDVARKVMMGGLATSRTGGGNQTNYGETPAQTSRIFLRRFKAPDYAVTPFSGGAGIGGYVAGTGNLYGMEGGDIWIDTDSDGDYDDNNGSENYKLAIKKLEAYDEDDYFEGNLAGVLQKVGDKAWWGNEFFYDGDGNNQQGGYIANRIGGNVTNMITDLQNTGADTWTPLAEAYYVATQYFKQEDTDGSLGYANGAVPPLNDTNDPYYQDSEFVTCAKSFVILLTDGASTKDSKIPAFLKDYDADGVDNTSCNESTNTNCDYSSGGTDYLDDVALYARTTDLRADLDGEQNIILYPIYAFGDDANARNLLKDAARNGGFVDKNGNNLPDGDYGDPAADRLEWDGNGDGDPDTFFEAQDGYALEAKLLEAINDILRRAASGTAVSVLATSSEGEGNLVQAYFRPVVTSGIRETKWVGYLQSLWVDSLGNLREDTNSNRTLDLDTDKVLSYFIDSSGNTKVNKWAVSVAAKYPDFDNDTPLIKELGDIIPIWEAGEELAERDPDDVADPRKIFTYIPGATADLYGGFEFVTTNMATIKPYLGVQDATAWDYMGISHDARAENLIHFIRGNDTSFSGTTNMRERTIEVNSIDRAWKLGDIVHSTPVSIAIPPDNYGVIYSDKTYQEYLNYHKNRADRETMVYVGANDGMLHAFTSWQYDTATKEFVDPTGNPFESIGKELWAYIPNSLLPHLKWLPDQDYNHVYYVDLKPKIFDARIFDENGDTVIDSDDDGSGHQNGWGTILVGGLRMGGKDIDVTDDFDYNAGTADTTQTVTSSYFAIDISDPRNPNFLWEKTYSGLGLTTSEPAVLKVGDKWFLSFGSGPETYEGASTQFGHIYVVDLETGIPYKGGGTTDYLFETNNDDAFLSGPTTLDKGLNFNVDAIFVGESHELASGAWEGGMYKVTVPWICTETVADACANVSYGRLGTINANCSCTYTDDPNDVTNPWFLSRLFDSPAPVTAPPSLSIDFSDNLWVYFGTGRYLSTDDKTTTDTQYLFGVKDPFFNSTYSTAPTDYYHNYSNTVGELPGLSPASLTTADLFDGDTYKVFYPWASYNAPAGDCTDITTNYPGQVGDIYGDGSCECSYDWPLSSCTPVDPVGDPTGCDGVADGSLGLVNDGRCECVPYVEPTWGCLEKTGSCTDIREGTMHDDTDYHSFYWRCTETTDGDCTGVTLSDIEGGYSSGGCDCVEVAVPSWSCTERPTGVCADVLPAEPNFGDTGDFTDPNDGLCTAGYWDCTENVADGCDSVDYTITDAAGFLGTNKDGDYFDNGECTCAFVDSPVAKVQNTTTNLNKSFDWMLTEARTKDGWLRILNLPGERALNKPTIIGGLALFTTYVPSSATCSFGGNSYLWALYFESGTAFKSTVFTPGTEVVDGMLVLTEKYSLGLGMASSVGIHIGLQEEGKVKGFIQQSTGAITDLPIAPAFNVRSGFRYWKEN